MAATGQLQPKTSKPALGFPVQSCTRSCDGTCADNYWIAGEYLTAGAPTQASGGRRLAVIDRELSGDYRRGGDRGGGCTIPINART
jgi:hypothetical protein